MYTHVLPIYIPDRWLAVSLNLRSALDSFSRISHPLRNAVPFGFWCGGFSSTAGLRSGLNEVQFTLNDFRLPSRLISSSDSATCFYPSRLRSKPFGFSKGRE